MEVQKILTELECSELLPKTALRAAIAQREEVAPALLRAFHDFVKGERPAPGLVGGLILPIHLLAEFGEQKAFPILVEFLHRDRAEVEYALGDVTTETLPRVLISLYSGDLDLLKGLILDNRVDQYVRWAGLEAWAYLAKVGRIDLNLTELFLMECHKRIPRGEDDHAWVGWQSAIALLGMDWLAPTVKKAFRDELISPFHMSCKDFERDLELTLQDPDGMALFKKEKLSPFEDTIGVFSNWYGFSAGYWEQRAEADLFSPSFGSGQEPETNPLRHLGRNDPCPCGSGRKYKKCCLNSTNPENWLKNGLPAISVQS